MSDIRFRKDNRYELRFYFENKRYSVYSKNKAKLKQKQKEKLQQLKIESVNKASKKYILTDWVDEWINTYKQPFISEASLDNLKIYFNKHILPAFGSMNLNKITIDILQPFLNNLPVNRTKELIITYFNACLKKANDLDLIKKNPFDLVVKDKKIKNIRPAFSIQQQESILNFVKSKDIDFYKLILFYLATGVRRNEALTIKAEDFDGLKLHIKGTKTKSSDRYIIVTEELKKMVIKESGLLFNYREDYVTKKFKDYLSSLGLTGTLHCLRHSYATNQYYLGTPAKEVQLLMGHSGVNITLDIYTNIQIGQDKSKIVKKITDLYNKYYIQLQPDP